MIILDKIVNFVIKILFALVFTGLLFLTYCYFCFYVLQKDYVNIFGYTFFEVGSGSMSPTILSNDVVIVKINDDYDVDDIITFSYQDNIITHRVKEIHGDSLITMGDANNVVDVSISKSDVIGKVVLICADVGIWKRVLMDPKVVFLVLITLILFIITFSYDKDLYKKFRMRRVSKKKLREFKREVRERKKKEKEREKKKKETKALKAKKKLSSKKVKSSD